MPSTDTLIQGALEQRNLHALFAALPLLKELDDTYVRELSQEIEWFSLPGGAPLYSAGQPADALYVIVNGAFGIYAGQATGGAQQVGKAVAGETAGAVELFTDAPRATTLVALRDSEVARIPRETFERLIERHPKAIQQVARGLAARIEALERPAAQRARVPRTFAIVPSDASPRAAELGRTLLDSLRRFGRCELVTSAQANEQTSHWFHRVERANDFVIYMTDARATNWSKRCLRQADVVLLVVRAGEAPMPCKALQGGPARPVEIVLLHDSSAASNDAGGWLDTQSCRRIHHVYDKNDVARVARLLTGRSVGVVLSGGGARGFAHIGVMRALQEAGFGIDAIGATSIGALVGAGFAAGWDHEEVTDRMRRCFVSTKPLSDYTVPLVALFAGRKVSRLMRDEFGDIGIEDLRLPYYCVSANLTTGQSAVHRRGKLWMWLRAAIAIPGVLPPVFARGQVHVDGATLNNLPIDTMREDIDGAIIGVDAGADPTFECDLEMTEMPPLWKALRLVSRRGPRINIVRILLRAGMMNSATTSLGQRELADLVLRPPLEHIDLLDWRAFDRAIDIGYRHAAETLGRCHGDVTVLRTSFRSGT
jgi:NTE family protein